MVEPPPPGRGAVEVSLLSGFIVGETTIWFWSAEKNIQIKRSRNASTASLRNLIFEFDSFAKSEIIFKTGGKWPLPIEGLGRAESGKKGGPGNALRHMAAEAAAVPSG